MEEIKSLFVSVGEFLGKMHINQWYVLLFICAGYIQYNYFGWYKKMNAAWKTLILGSIFSFIYALLLRNVTDKTTWIEFCASYVFATSLYEIILKKLAAWVIYRVQAVFKKKLEIPEELIQKD